MLRRNFVKTAILTGSGLILSSSVLFSRENISKKKIGNKRIKYYNLRGDRKSGCASPPNILRNIEGGLNCLPFK